MILDPFRKNSETRNSRTRNNNRDFGQSKRAFGHKEKYEQTEKYEQKEHLGQLRQFRQKKFKF